jgi:DNA-binding CsgD family transcriptional regulator
MTGPHPTPREVEALRACLSGRTQKEAAVLLGISPFAVKARLRALYLRLGLYGAHAREQAIEWADANCPGWRSEAA